MNSSIDADVFAVHRPHSLRFEPIAERVGAFSEFRGVREENLRHVFDVAEDGGVILFFDES